MSAATLNDYSTQERNTESQQVQAERTRILNMVSRKAQEQTLTLEETTALYEKFNRTYSAYRSNEPQSVDESWALELLQECEQEEIEKAYESTLFQTRINGIPHKAKSKLNNCKQDAPAPANDVIIVDQTSSVAAKPFTPQDLNFDLNESFGKKTSTTQRHDAFATFVITSSIITLAALLGFSIFF